ncbi:MAG: transposase [Bacteroidota bacterium]|nr:transposase [Bacteroidota bacterium]
MSYCQKNKGLMVYAWVLMSNHFHLIAGSGKEPLSNIIRDLKKFTTKSLTSAIEVNEKESRKRWLLWLLKKEGQIWFWEEGYHGEEFTSREFLKL